MFCVIFGTAIKLHYINIYILVILQSAVLLTRAKLCNARDGKCEKNSRSYLENLRENYDLTGEFFNVVWGTVVVF